MAICWVSIDSILSHAGFKIRFKLLGDDVTGSDSTYCADYVREFNQLHSPTGLSIRRLAEKSWPGYHYTHYEADDESYQNEDDERLRIDKHRSYPFSANPVGLEKEQSIIRDDALQRGDDNDFGIYNRFTAPPSYAPRATFAKSQNSQLPNNIFRCLRPNDTRDECLDRKIGSCGNSPAYSSKRIPSFKKAV